MKARFSVTAQAMQSLVTSIWVWEVSGMAENKSINVRTDISTAQNGWRAGAREQKGGGAPILAVLALAKFDMMVLDVFMSATSLSTCLEHSN